MLKKTVCMEIPEDLQWGPEDSEAAKKYLADLDAGKIRTVVMNASLADLLSSEHAD